MASGNPRKILFLTASSGGGHSGLMLGLEERLAGDRTVQIESVDLYDVKLLRPFRWLAGIRRYSNFLWKLFLRSSDSPHTTAVLFFLLRRPLAAALIRKAYELFPEGPDTLIAVHHLGARCLETVAAGFLQRPRTVVFVSDYEPHWLWIAKADAYAVASDHAEHRLRQSGYPPEAIHRLSYLPCRGSEICHVPERNSDYRAFKVVIAAGADGTYLRNVDRILECLDLAAPRIQQRQLEVSVVCGRNDAAVRRLHRFSPKNYALSVLGFVDDLPGLLRKSDVAILRAGPQTLTEALFAEVPILIFEWHAHEIGNCRLFESKHHAEVAPVPSQVANKIVAMANGTYPPYDRMLSAARRAKRTLPTRPLLEMILQA